MGELVMEEENRFKVVEIEKYNSEIEKNEKKIREYAIWTGLFGLELVLLITGIPKTISIIRLMSVGGALVDLWAIFIYLKKLVIAIFKKTILEQKLMDIESHIDERIEEMLNNVQLEINNRMQEAIDGGKQR